MKKKVILPIVFSSIALLMGGLIYLGVSAFPELLEEEEEVEAKKTVAHNVADFRMVSNEAEPSEPAEIEIASVTEVNSNYVSLSNKPSATNTRVYSNFSKSKVDFVIVDHSFAGELIVVDSHSFIKHDNDDEKSFVVPNETTVEQQVASDEHTSYSSYLEKTDESVHQEKAKVKKSKANNYTTTRSNEALAETSILVIGAVDVFSMILIHRRKHLFR